MPNDSTTQAPNPSIDHCVSKIIELAQREEVDRRAILQLGYNLGRLGELTGLGREPFWDRWKDAVADWDRETLGRLVRQLRVERASWPT